MIYIKVNDEKVVISRYFMPFDEQYGLGKTREELLQEGFLVDSIPEPKQVDGKVSILKYDGSEFYYEYIDVPMTPEEQTKNEIELLKAQNAQMLFALVEGGLL